MKNNVRSVLLKRISHTESLVHLPFERRRLRCDDGGYQPHCHHRQQLPTPATMLFYFRLCVYTYGSYTRRVAIAIQIGNTQTWAHTHTPVEAVGISLACVVLVAVQALYTLFSARRNSTFRCVNIVLEWTVNLILQLQPTSRLKRVM